MTANTLPPSDRASFNEAMNAILTDHATLRRLAVVTTTRACFSADDVLSLADAVASHERTEARLFELPFVARPPEAVTTTAERARQHCIEYTSGDFHFPDSRAAAALFVDALLAHLTAEEAWLAEEEAHQKERLLIAA